MLSAVGQDRVFAAAVFRTLQLRVKRSPSTVFFGQPNDTMDTFLGAGRSGDAGVITCGADVAEGA